MESLFRPRGIDAEAVEALKAIIRKLEPGAVAEYKTLSAAAGRAVVGATSILQRAKRELEREERILIAPVRGTGVRRLTAEQAIEESTKDRRGIRRKAGRASRKLSTVNMMDVKDNKLQVIAAFNAGIFGALSVMLQGQRCAAAMTGVRSVRDLPPPREMIKDLLR